MFGPIKGGSFNRPAPYGKKPEETDEEAEFKQLMAEVEAEGKQPSGATGDKMDGAWTCKSCGNVNFRHREVCNTRKCSQPRCLADSALEGHPEGSWLCPGCGNINWKNRSVCHTRKCGQPFPGGPGALQQRPPPWAGPQGPAPWASGPMGMGMFPGNMVCTFTETPNGPWRCPNCGNHNYAEREVCNTRKCRLPRPRPGAIMSGGPPQGFGKGSFGGGRQFGGVPPGIAKQMNKISPLKQQEQQQQQQQGQEGGPKGEWVCIMCGNVNYGFRTVCNTRKCSAPKPL